MMLSGIKRVLYDGNHVIRGEGMIMDYAQKNTVRLLWWKETLQLMWKKTLRWDPNLWPVKFESPSSLGSPGCSGVTHKVSRAAQFLDFYTIFCQKFWWARKSRVVRDTAVFCFMNQTFPSTLLKFTVTLTWKKQKSYPSTRFASWWQKYHVKFSGPDYSNLAWRNRSSENKNVCRLSF